MEREFLFDSLQDFYNSGIWRGYKAYPYPPAVKPWFGWVYIAAFNGYTKNQYLKVNRTQNLKFKIGMTYNLKRRGEELRRENKEIQKGGNDEEKNDEEKNVDDMTEEDSLKDNVASTSLETEQVAGPLPSAPPKKKTKWSKQIVYAFSVPQPALFELTVKRFLKHFIDKDLRDKNDVKVDGATEIVQGIAFEPLVHIIQICILQTCISNDFLKDDGYLKRNFVQLVSSPPDTIVWMDYKYYGRRVGTNTNHTFHIGDGIQTTIAESLHSKIVDSQDGDFDLLGKLELTDKPAFLTYVLDRGDPSEDKRLPEKNQFLEGVDYMPFTTDVASAPRSPYYSVGDLVFAEYNKKDGYFPVEIIGYHRKQYLVRWIDRRRYNKKTKKWTEEWTDIVKKNKNKSNIRKNSEEKNDDQRIKAEQLSDFLMENLIQGMNDPAEGNRYRDYIQKKPDAMDMKAKPPSSTLVPFNFEKVSFEYKNHAELTTWNALWPGIVAPSNHWKTIKKMKKQNKVDNIDEGSVYEDSDY